MGIHEARKTPNGAVKRLDHEYRRVKSIVHYSLKLGQFNKMMRFRVFKFMQRSVHQIMATSKRPKPESEPTISLLS